MGTSAEVGMTPARNNRQIEVRKSSCYHLFFRNFGERHLIALLTWTGFAISSVIRCNSSNAIVEIITGTGDKRMIESFMTKSQNDTEDLIETVVQKDQWSLSLIGGLDKSFHWAYAISQIPGGLLAARFPANDVFGVALLTSFSLNMIIPIAVQIHPSLVTMLKFVQGLAEGVTLPACYGIWQFWAPPLERSKLATISLGGISAGLGIELLLPKVFKTTLNWAIFYLFACIGIAWWVFWHLFSFEKPSTHPSISDEERVYIEQALKASSRGDLNKNYPIPWKSFFTSMPVYAIMVASFCHSWTFYLLIISQPTYFSKALKYNIAKSGFLSALPHLIMAIIVPFGGQLADFLRMRGVLTTTTVRKIFNCGGFGMEAIFLLAVGFSRSSFWAVFFLTIAVGSSGFAISGFNVNHLDIAPRYASILMGMSNGVGTLSGMLCPTVLQRLTRHKTIAEWELVFIITSVVHCGGIIFYAIFASGEKQPWADPSDEDITVPLDKSGGNQTGTADSGLENNY